MKHINAEQIVKAAEEMGFSACGIIPVDMMRGYEDKLEERIARFPETKEKYSAFRKFANPAKQYPWAKSVVVLAFWYGKYHIPEELKGKFAKYYLVDGRANPESEQYKANEAFTGWLSEKGIRYVGDRKFGITSLRWAAMKAGIGIIRKNNFFYTSKGSWNALDAYLIDLPAQYIRDPGVRPCPRHCNLCMKNCPTGSLEAPYMMSRNTCVSCLTTWDAWDLTKEPLRDRLGTWIYGCESCQDCCPFNHNAWMETEEFPGLPELAKHLSMEEIVLADYEYLENVVNPKLWYIPKEKCWRYKTNALNGMLNDYKPEYRPVIEQACSDENEEVRKMARWVLEHY